MADDAAPGSAVKVVIGAHCILVAATGSHQCIYRRDND